MSSKSLKDLKIIVAVGYAAWIFTLLFCAWLYSSSFLTGPLSEFTNAIALALVFTAIVSLVYNVHLHRKLRRGDVRIKRVKGRPEPQPAAILLAVIPGLIGLLGIGHLYLGKRRRGTFYLLFGLLVIALALVYPPSVFSLEFVFILGIYTVAWVWQIVDAYRLAKA